MKLNHAIQCVYSIHVSLHCLAVNTFKIFIRAVADSIELVQLVFSDSRTCHKFKNSSFYFPTVFSIARCFVSFNFKIDKETENNTNFNNEIYSGNRQGFE